MIPILANLLKKRGIEKKDDLTIEEAAQFEKWEGILSKDVSVDSIRDFCHSQLRRIETEWKDLDKSKERNDRLIVMHTVYKQLIAVIESPKAEREALEKYLQSLI